MLTKNIKYLRAVSGLSQAAFGQLFAVSRSMIDSYERGNARPSNDLLMAMSSHFKLSIDVLLTSELSGRRVFGYSSPHDPDKANSKDAMIAELIKQIKSQQATILNQQAIIDQFLSVVKASAEQ